MLATIAILLAGGLVGGQAAAAELDASASVLVQARESGQGLLRGRGAECFVLTPAHVVTGTAGAVRVTGERSAQVSALLQRTLPGDIAILRVDAPGSVSCPEWSVVPALASLLNGRDAGTLSSREADGSRTLMPVSFTAIDDEAIYVRPSRTGDEISKTMSGSPLMVDGRVVGLLLAVDEGVGEVYQIDDVMRVSSEFFAPPAKPASMSVSTYAGQYNFAGAVVTIQGVANGLQYIQAGSPVHTLVAGPAERFTATTLPGSTIEFRRDEYGAVDAMFLTFPQGVIHGPRVEGPAPDLATLRSLVGTYYINDAVNVTVALRSDGVLTYRATPDQSDSILLPARGLHFALQNNPYVSVVFHRGTAGLVSHIVVYVADTTVVARRRP